MTFRARIAISAAAAVALTVVAASVLLYLIARQQLRAPVDKALEARAAEIGHDLRVFEGPQGKTYLAVRPDFGEARGYVQLVQSDGTRILPPLQHVELPVPQDVLAIADRDEGGLLWNDVTVDGVHMRMLTFPYANATLQVARPLTEVDESLDRIGLFLLLIAAGGVVVAAALGLLVARAALAPVKKLTSTVERVTETQDLSQRIDVDGEDELSRLAASFNTMLSALEESTRAQRQLVADASHELRTPLTSVRTNIEVLAGDRMLPPEDRRRLLTDVVEQLGEMTMLISELIELARAEQQVVDPENVRLDLLVTDAVERARRNRPDVVYSVNLEPVTVLGVPATIERAVGNLLDNAAKWSPTGAEVEVAVRDDGSLVVRDHGPGIVEEDLPFVFDRFYRAREARGMPGSGLGLAIVRQVAETHGGEVVAERAEGGGTRMVLTLGSPRPVAGAVTPGSVVGSS